MVNIRWQTSLVLLVVISLPVIVIFMSQRLPTATELGPTDNNPDKFYMWCTTDKVVSVAFTYDPHAADAWMFRTAEGHLGSSNIFWTAEGYAGASNHTPNPAPEPTATAR